MLAAIRLPITSLYTFNFILVSVVCNVLYWALWRDCEGDRNMHGAPRTGKEVKAGDSHSSEQLSSSGRC